MHSKRLTDEQARLLMDLKNLGLSNVEIASKLGISEGAVRYRIKRHETGRHDGRKDKPSQLEQFWKVISIWIDDYKDEAHRPTLRALHDMLKRFHGYHGSYDALRRYVRQKFPEFVQKGARTRIETPPGVLLQVDWKEDVLVQLGAYDRWVKIQGLSFNLGFSRKTCVWVGDTKSLAAFMSGHQAAFNKFGGLPAYIRTDCLRSAIVRWNGERSILNERYRKYMSDLGIEVFPARPGTATDKGKVEKRIGDLFRRIDLKHRIFEDVLQLQRFIDRALVDLEGEWTCGATGLSIRESFEYEKGFLKPLPESFPELPLREARTKVRRDGTARCILAAITTRFRRYTGTKAFCACIPGRRFAFTTKGTRSSATAICLEQRGW
jgi:transposase